MWRGARILRLLSAILPAGSSLKAVLMSATWEKACGNLLPDQPFRFGIVLFGQQPHIVSQTSEAARIDSSRLSFFPKEYRRPRARKNTGETRLRAAAIRRLFAPVW